MNQANFSVYIFCVLIQVMQCKTKGTLYTNIIYSMYVHSHVKNGSPE